MRSIDNLQIYREVRRPGNEISDPAKTLRDFGMMGGDDEEQNQYTLVYTFTPRQTSCPLLLASQHSRVDEEVPA